MNAMTLPTTEDLGSKTMTFAGHDCTVTPVVVLRSTEDDLDTGNRIGGAADLPVGYEVPCFTTEENGPADTPLGHILTLDTATINADDGEAVNWNK